MGMVRLLPVCKDNHDSTSVDIFSCGKLDDFKLNKVSYSARDHQNGCTLIHILFFFVESLMFLTLLL